MHSDGLTIPGLDSLIADTHARIEQTTTELVAVPSLGECFTRIIKAPHGEKQNSLLLPAIHGKVKMDLGTLRVYHNEMVAFSGRIKNLIKTQEQKMVSADALLKQLLGEKKRKEAEIHDTAKASFEAGQAKEAEVKGKKKPKKTEDTCTQ